MGDPPLGRAADPPGVAVAGGDATIERLCVFQEHERPLRPRLCVAEQRRHVHGPLVDLRQQRAERVDVAHPLTLGLQVSVVVQVGGGGEVLEPFHLDALGANRLGLARVVGEQTHRTDAERGEHRRGLRVVAAVNGQAEPEVGVQRVGASVLLPVGAQLVDQPDTAPLVPSGVHEHAAALRGQGTKGELKLRPAVAAQRPEGLAGQALGVHAGQQRASVADVAAHQREVDAPAASLERADVELAGRRGQAHAGDFTEVHHVACASCPGRPETCAPL